MEWQPIETAPKDGSAIILCRNGAVWAGYYATKSYMPKVYRWVILDTASCDGEFNNEWMVEMNALSNKRPPTHWQPLPDPPK